MQINSLTPRVNIGHNADNEIKFKTTTSPVPKEHTFRELEKQSPMAWESHGPVASTTPIGYQFDPNKPTQKSDDLKQILANVDLRHISPNQLKDVVGAALSVRGEISDQASFDFAVLGIAKDNMDKDASIDVIQFFEDMYSLVSSEVEAGENTSESKKMYGETLHTLYNLDNFIQFAKNGGKHIDVKV